MSSEPLQSLGPESPASQRRKLRGFDVTPKAELAVLVGIDVGRRGSWEAEDSLAELELRAATGATVLAIVRGSAGIAVPDAHEPLREADVLAIAGTSEAIEAAIAVLGGTEEVQRAGQKSLLAAEHRT